jgi:hypothetical protein
MNNYEKIYWLTRLDNFESFFITLVSIGSTFIVIRTIYRLDRLFMEEECASLKWYTHLFFWSIYISSILGILFIPTKEEAVIIFAGGKTIDFIEADSSIQKIPHQTTEIISKFMEKEILEINKELENKKE